MTHDHDVCQHCGGATAPDYPRRLIRFDYKGRQVQIDHASHNEVTGHTVWVKHNWGWVVAIPFVVPRDNAVRDAKQWIDEHPM